MSRFFALALAAAAAVLMAAVPLQAAESNTYTVTPLVSDQSTLAGPPDTTLVNAWGLVAGLTANGSTPWWVADNGTNASTLYNGAGAKQALTVGVAGGPTGIVFNGAGAASPVAGGSVALHLRHRGRADPRLARRSRVGAGRPSTARRTARSTRASPSRRRRTAACLRDRLPQRTRRRLRRARGRSSCTPGAFVDPALPRDYAPFGIQAIGGAHLRHLREAGRGRATTRSPARAAASSTCTTRPATLLARVAQHGQLNAPWGLAWRRRRFGALRRRPARRQLRRRADQRLRGAANGAVRASRRSCARATASTLTIDGLWALEFGHGATAAARRTRSSSPPGRTTRATGSSARSPRARHVEGRPETRAAPPDVAC